jgi:hypothetical protein
MSEEIKQENFRETAPEATFSALASSLGVMFLEDSIRGGKVVEIPSLGIILTKENLRVAESKSNGTSNHESNGHNSSSSEGSSGSSTI